MGFFSDWNIIDFVAAGMTGGLSVPLVTEPKKERKKAQRELDAAIATAERQTQEAMALLNEKPKAAKKPTAPSVLYGMDTSSSTALTGPQGSLTMPMLGRSKVLGS